MSIVSADEVSIDIDFTHVARPRRQSRPGYFRLVRDTLHIDD
jgi:hypothetical protein